DPARDHREHQGAGQEQPARVTVELQPQVQSVAPPMIELGDELAEVAPDPFDILFQPSDVLPRVVHAKRSFVNRMSRDSAVRLVASGLRTRRRQLRPARTATAAAITPVTIRPAPQTGITSPSANAAVTS